MARKGLAVFQFDTLDAAVFSQNTFNRAGPLNTKAIAGKTGSSYVGAGNALKRLSRAGKVKSRKAGRERIWQLASADVKPAGRKARSRAMKRGRKAKQRPKTRKTS